MLENISQSHPHGEGHTHFEDVYTTQLATQWNQPLMHEEYLETASLQEYSDVTVATLQLVR